jgi:hypothetical protein
MMTAKETGWLVPSIWSRRALRMLENDMEEQNQKALKTV